MFILVYRDLSRRERTRAWKFTDHRPDIAFSSIISFTAKNEALLRVRTVFSNVPIPLRSDEAIWKGEMATFLYDNMM